MYLWSGQYEGCINGLLVSLKCILFKITYVQKLLLTEIKNILSKTFLQIDLKWKASRLFENKMRDN